MGRDLPLHMPMLSDDERAAVEHTALAQAAAAVEHL